MFAAHAVIQKLQYGLTSTFKPRSQKHIFKQYSRLTRTCFYETRPFKGKHLPPQKQNIIKLGGVQLGW